MNEHGKDSPEALRETIDRYNAAWNAHDLDAIMAMHAPDMVFENHTAGESAVGEEARAHIGSIFAAWPDIAFATRRLYVREGLVVQEWTASATHTSPKAPTTTKADLHEPSSSVIRIFMTCGVMMAPMLAPLCSTLFPMVRSFSFSTAKVVFSAQGQWPASKKPSSVRQTKSCS